MNRHSIAWLLTAVVLVAAGCVLPSSIGMVFAGFGGGLMLGTWLEWYIRTLEDMG